MCEVIAFYIFRQSFGSPGGESVNPETYSGNDFLTETWFIALLGSMVAVMVLLFAAMLLVRRRQLELKKSTFPGLHGTLIFSYCFLNFLLAVPRVSVSFIVPCRTI